MRSLISSAIVLVFSTLSNAFLFSPYKDATIGFDWTANVVSTTALRDAGLNSVTWAFATGVCGSETWAGVAGDTLAAANVPLWSSSGLKYVISTGGANGAFTCASADSLKAFVERYRSDGLVGIDFDVEGGVSQSNVDALVSSAHAVLKQYPELRISFTVATTAYALGTYGLMVVDAFQRLGGDGLFVNLMAMDYGNAGNCVAVDGVCDMGASAVRAAKSFSDAHGVPLSRVEVTVMIGGNDTPNETFTLADVDTLTAFARDSGLAGLHFWSLDRDSDCAPGPAQATCNSYGQAGPLGFTKRFLNNLGGQPQPAPAPTTSTPTTSTPTSAATPAPKPTPTKRATPKPTKGLWRIPTSPGC